ncbi:MAG: potassium transporter TrkG [Candidatus Micrarchaeota archaeon]
MGSIPVLHSFGVLMFALSGLDIFTSINLTFTAVSTGGFMPSSMFSFTSIQKLVFIFLMLVGATSFALHLRIGNGDWRAILRNTEFKMMMLLVVLFSSFIVLTTKDGPIDAMFDVTAAISGAGFSIRDMSVFSDLAKYLLVLLMVSGACSGSTTGALKLWRMFAVLKTIGNNIKSVFLPKGAVQVVKINGKALTREQIIDSGNYIFLYMFILFAAAGMVMTQGIGVIDSVFVTASAMGNVGLSTVNIAVIPNVVKNILVVCMYLGRVEILPSLVMLKYIRG